MRLFLSILLCGCIFGCSSSPEVLPEKNETPEAKATKNTESCLDNPDLAREWGECNVKHTLFVAGTSFAKCRGLSPTAKGTIHFELHIKADGRVKSAKALDNGQKKLAACVSKVMRKLQFAAPPAGKEPKITVPFQLEP